jgi:CSLREA domain-containing protein
MFQSSRLFKLVVSVLMAGAFVLGMGIALHATTTVEAAAMRDVIVTGRANAPTATIVVNDLGDTSGTCATTGTGTCTLRDAITFANGHAGADTITFSTSGTILLASTLVITDDVTIDASGQSINVSGNSAVRVLSINTGVKATLNALTIVNGYTPDISAFGGAGIYNAGILTVTNSTFSGNSANSGFGGGIANYYGTLTVINSTFSGNGSAYGSTHGGGIENYYGTLTVINSTFNGNSGAYGGGIDNTAGTATLHNTIIANSSSVTGNCYNTFIFSADAYNLADDNTCDSATQKTTAQINLGPLANNGGNTPTVALLPGSAAIDAGNDAVCPATDQRGVARPLSLHCDVGAYEFSIIATNDSPTLLGSATTLTATTYLTPLMSLTWNFSDGNIPITGNPVTHTYGSPGFFTAIVTATSGQGTFTATTTVLICTGNTISNTNDDGVGSLRRAVLCAPPGATLTFSPALVNQTITLTTGEIAINKALTIDGSNAPNIKISGNNASRAFNVSAAVTLNALTIQNSTGGIYNGGTLTVTNSTFSGNVVPNIGDSGDGGGIENSGTLTVINSTFSGNEARQGGGISNYGTLTIINSTFYGNDTGGYPYGSGIFNAGTTTLSNTILANSGSQNCYLFVGTFTADAYNLATDATCGSATQKTFAQINLGPLANNGGNTPTHALLSGSAAIDTGDDTNCPATDQRGVLRPQGSHCDVGAYEYVFPTTTLSASNNSPTPLGNATAFTATIDNGSGFTFAWDFGDNATGSGANITHTYISVGNYLATVTATKGIGTLVATTPVTITDAAITGLNASNDGPTSLGSATHFSATITSGSNVTYVWDFGDGSATAPGAMVTHAYAAMGNYTAIVTATNPINSMTATTPVVIKSPYDIYLPLVLNNF